MQRFPLRNIGRTQEMKRTWVIPAILVAGLTGFGSLAFAASAQDSGWRDGPGYSRDDDRGEYGGRRWNDDDRRDDDDRGPRWRRGDRGYDGERGPRWRDDDRRGYGPREGRRFDGDSCGPRGRGYGRGGDGWQHHGHGYGRHHDGYGRGRGDMGRGDMGRGDMGRGYDRRDDSDRGYGRHRGYHHRHDGRGPGRFGRAFDPARLDSAKKEIGVTTAQEQAWTKYASTLKEVSDARKARRDGIDRSAITKMSPDEFRKFRDGMIDQRRKEQDSVNAAVDELVKSLDEKQLAIAKEVLPGYALGGFMRGASMGGGRDR
jgi:hypothetical protein